MAIAAQVAQNKRKKRAEKKAAEAAAKRKQSIAELKGPASQLTDAQFMELRAAFDGFDVDGSGVLEIDEMRDALRLTGLGSTDEEIEALIMVIDSNQDGTVDWEEFLEFSAAQLTDPGGSLITNELDMAFECLLAHCATDTRSRGALRQPAPFRMAADKMNQQLLDVGYVAELMRSAGTSPLSEDEALEFYKDLSVDGSGLIRFGSLKELPCWQSLPHEEGARQAVAPADAVKAAKSVQQAAMRELRRYESTYGVKIEIADSGELPAGKSGMFRTQSGMLLPVLPNRGNGEGGTSFNGDAADAEAAAAAEQAQLEWEMAMYEWEQQQWEWEQYQLAQQQQEEEEAAQAEAEAAQQAERQERERRKEEERQREQARQQERIRALHRQERQQRRQNDEQEREQAKVAAVHAASRAQHQPPPSRPRPVSMTPAGAGSSMAYGTPYTRASAAPPSPPPQPRSTPERRSPGSGGGGPTGMRGGYGYGYGGYGYGYAQPGQSPAALGQETRLVAAGGLSMATSGVRLPEDSIELSAPPRELLAHAQLEAAQTKLEVLQALAQAKMELAEAKLNAVHAHVPEDEQAGGWWTSLWHRPEGSDLSA